MVAAGLAGAAALAGARRTLANDAPPETSSVRLAAEIVGLGSLAACPIYAVNCPADGAAFEYLG
jgi:hypothetical protein